MLQQSSGSCCWTLKPDWGVQGGARVIKCLQDFREELGYECRATLLDHDFTMAADIDFKYNLKHACPAETGRFCNDIPHGDIIRCLQVGPSDVWCCSHTSQGLGPAAYCCEVLSGS